MRKFNPAFPGDSNLNDNMSEEYLCAKLHLVDLAGSERAKRTGSDGLRFKEGEEFVCQFLHLKALLVIKELCNMLLL